MSFQLASIILVVFEKGMQQVGSSQQTRGAMPGFASSMWASV